MEVGFTLKIQFKDADTRLTSELVGKSDGKYLIIKMPPIHVMGDTYELIYKGNEVIIRYLQNGTIFGFKSRIKDFILSPEKLIFLEYPKKIENHELRTNKRIDCFLPANIGTKDCLGIIRGSIIDISKEGCSFSVEALKTQAKINLLDINSTIVVNFQIPGVENELTTEAIVKNIKKDKDKINVGFWFINMDNEVQAKFFDFLLTAGA